MAKGGIQEGVREVEGAGCRVIEADRKLSKGEKVGFKQKIKN